MSHRLRHKVLGGTAAAFLLLSSALTVSVSADDPGKVAGVDDNPAAIARTAVEDQLTIRGVVEKVNGRTVVVSGIVLTMDPLALVEDGSLTVGSLVEIKASEVPFGMLVAMAAHQDNAGAVEDRPGRENEAEHPEVEAGKAVSATAYQAWARARMAKGEDPADGGAFRLHLRAIGADDNPGAHQIRIGDDNPASRQTRTRGADDASDTAEDRPALSGPVYQSWAAARLANGQNTDDSDAFRAHLRAIGVDDNPGGTQTRTQTRTQTQTQTQTRTRGADDAPDAADDRITMMSGPVYQAWAAARLAQGQDPNDRNAFRTHLRAIGIDDDDSPEAEHAGRIDDNPGAGSNRGPGRADDNPGASSGRDNSRVDDNPGASSGRDNSRVDDNPGAGSGRDSGRVDDNPGTESNSGSGAVDDSSGRSGGTDDNSGASPTRTGDDNPGVESGSGSGRTEDSSGSSGSGRTEDRSGTSGSQPAPAPAPVVTQPAPAPAPAPVDDNSGSGRDNTRVRD